ncbi:MAG: shikimate kinase [Desulfopila sp.]
MTEDLSKKSNIVLIGMPGSGKSTVGIILAKILARNFVDTDVLIQLQEGLTLQEIIDSSDYMALRRIEEEVLIGIDHRQHVVATGGSAPYSHRAMAHLREDGIIVFLDADLPCLCSRIQNYQTRGLAKRPEQSFQELFAERYRLYSRYSDITIDCSARSQEEVCQAIIDQLDRHRCRQDHEHH